MKMLLIVFLSLLVVFVFYLNHERDTRVNFQLEGKSHIYGVNITQKKRGATNWMLNAEKALFLSDVDIELSKLKMTFPEKGLVLTSDSGIYNVKSRNLEIIGNIIASTESYDILATTLFWDSSENKLFSDYKIQIVGRGFFITGDSLAATTDKMKLRKNVRAVFYEK
ncbi:LPS export ABC transporter periplasmic protein LptC [Thermodesulfovibrionales bacterium]|nr:LPS export ABC transporter periplasmic protein LptC [Thermodesulfovibrionales bacterium]